MERKSSLSAILMWALVSDREAGDKERQGWITIFVWTHLHFCPVSPDYSSQHTLYFYICPTLTPTFQIQLMQCPNILTLQIKRRLEADALCLESTGLQEGRSRTESWSKRKMCDDGQSESTAVQCRHRPTYMTELSLCSSVWSACTEKLMQERESDAEERETVRVCSPLLLVQRHVWTGRWI